MRLNFLSVNPEVRIDLRNDRDDAPLKRPAKIAVS